MGSKDVYVKIFDNDGNFKKTFLDFSFAGLTYSPNPAGTTINIPYSYDDPILYANVQDGYKVYVYIADSESPAGKLMYSGTIDSIDTGDVTTINCIGFVADLNFDILEQSQMVRIKFPKQDLGQTVADIIDNYRGNSADPQLDYESVTTTGVVESFDVYVSSPLDAIREIQKMLGTDFFIYITPDNIVKVKSSSTAPKHLLTYGKDVSSLKINRNTSSAYNKLLFTNGLDASDPEAIFKVFSASSSIFDRRFTMIRDGRYRKSAGTYNTVGQNLVDLYSQPLTTVELEVVDSNVGGGYDLESIEVFDRVKLLNTNSEYLTDDMIITGIQYYLDTSRLIIADRRQYVSRLLAEQKQAYNNVAFSDNLPIRYTT